MFLDTFFALQTLSNCNFESVDLQTGYKHLLKALKEEKLTQYLKMGVEGENIWPPLYIESVATLLNSKL